MLFNRIITLKWYSEKTTRGSNVKLIIGANGRTGRLVVEELLAEGERPRVMVRDTQTAEHRFGDRVDIVEGDLNNKASVQAAMQRCHSVFLCTPINPMQVEQQNAVIDAAALNNAYVVKLSGLATYPDSFVDSGLWHAQSEAYLAASGTAFTCLHPYCFMQNMDAQLPGIIKTGVLRSAVSEAAITMVDAHDIAAVAARLLCNPSLAPGQTLPLTSSSAYSYPEMAEIMSEVFQCSVSFKTQTLTDLQENLKKIGLPGWHAKIIVQFNRAFAEGLAATPHPAVRDILQRDPISFEQYLRNFISTHTGNPT